jgi:hypothetical protein
MMLKGSAAIASRARNTLATATAATSSTGAINHMTQGIDWSLPVIGVTQRATKYATIAPTISPPVARRAPSANTWPATRQAGAPRVTRSAPGGRSRCEEHRHARGEVLHHRGEHHGLDVALCCSEQGSGHDSDNFSTAPIAIDHGAPERVTAEVPVRCLLVDHADAALAGPIVFG